MSKYDNLLKSELTKQAQEMEETIGNCLEEIKQLKGENEELKERFSYFHHTDVEFEQERNAFINEIKKNNKLEQTLNDIKSLCYEQDLDEDFFACEVLQKISECEVK